MGRVVRIIVWAVILFAFYFFVSTLFKSCGSNNGKVPAQNEMVDNNEDPSDNSDEEYFEDYEDGEGVVEQETADADDVNNETEDTQDFEKPISSSAVEEEPKEIKKEEPKAQNTQTKPSPNSTTINSSSGDYLVITGSFLMESNAKNMVNKLKNMGYSNAGIIIFEASQYYSVTSGTYASRSDASTVVQSLKSSGVDCYVHKKQ